MQSRHVTLKLLAVTILFGAGLLTDRARGGPGAQVPQSAAYTHTSRLPQAEPGWIARPGEDRPAVCDRGDSGGHHLRGLVEQWIYEIGAPALSSPRFADVDGDGVKDVVVSTYDPVDPYSAGRVYVIDVDGNDLPGWPVTTIGPVPASPAVADIDDDGDVEVIVGSWQRAYIWNHDGTAYPGWPKSRGAYVSPAVEDLDGDGDLEIIYAGTNRSLYVWHHDGTALSGWPYAAPELVGTPAVGDVDGDGLPEIAAGTYQGPTGPDPFEVYLWNADGTVAPGFPLATSGIVKAAPALGDIDRDGEVEIVVCAYHTSNNDYLYAWDAQGNLKPGWPVRPRYGRLSGPSLGDLDGDGYLEVVIGGYSTDPTEQVYAYNHDGSAVVGWPVVLTHSGSAGNVNSTPIIADIDGDATQVEVVVKAREYVFAVHADGTLVDGFPYALSDEGHSGTLSPTPAVGDCDGDGDVEYVFVSNYGRVVFFDEPGAFPDELAFWPMFKHDACGTAYVSETPIVGDIDGDGDVDLADLATLLAAYATCEGDPAYNPDADFDDSGCVDLADLAALLANYGSGT